MKSLNHYISINKAQLQKGDILIAYNELVKFVMKMRVDLMKSHTDQYSFSGILHGYMDYTYFYYTNDFLKARKLKLGFVLNHLDMRFEIWLLGNTAKVQKEYWLKMKESKWNEGVFEMPQYYILSAVIDADPDFDDLPRLRHSLESQMMQISSEILDAITD